MYYFTLAISLSDEAHPKARVSAASNRNISALAGDEPSLLQILPDSKHQGTSADHNYLKHGSDPAKSKTEELEPPDQQTLQLTLAWLLDVFMELQVPGWKAVMTDINRTRGKKWFRGIKLNRAEVARAILAEMDADEVKPRTLDKHVDSALAVIKHSYSVRAGFRPRQVRKANCTLHGLAKAIAEVLSRKGEAPKLNLDSPDQLANFLYAEFPLPDPLKFDEVSRQLNTSWG